MSRGNGERPPGGKSRAADDAKAARLAAALRANLKRRKTQARDRAAAGHDAGSETGETGPKSR